MSEDVKTDCLLWQPNTTQKFQKRLIQVARGSNDALRILIMNVEALSTKKGTSVANDFLKLNPDSFVAVDESTTIKNRQAQRTKNIIKLGKQAKYKRILTGSPITKNPMDLFSQCAFLNSSILGFDSYYAFQGRYAVVTQRKFGARSFQQITGYRNLEELNCKIEKHSHRVLKEDCLDLPDKIYMQRQVTLTSEQENAYKQMKEYALAMLDRGELATTQSVLTQILRLQEICCGHLRTDDGEIQPLASNRMNEMLDVIGEMIGKVIIWASYVYDIEQIQETLAGKFGAESVVTFYGATPQDERDNIVATFQDPDSPVRFFVANPRTGGFGLTLTAATTVLYYNNSYDLEIRLQSEDRAHRITQNHHVLYVDLVSPNTVDEKIIKALKSKINIAQQVLGEEAKGWLI
jgi:SNF2 family DNA or RNA helicase